MIKRWSVAFIGVLILLMVFTACGGNTIKSSGERVEPDGDGLPPVAAVKARETLSDELSIGIEDVAIVSHIQKTWLDSCLGLGGVSESCLQTEEEGWLVEFSVNGETYKAHTDWLGEQIRFEP